MSCVIFANGAALHPIMSKILVVDDESDILPEYQVFFEFAGFSTETSADPVAAFDLVLNTPDIGLVMTDLRVAKLNAARMIRELRAALPPERRIEFIILTGDASTPDFDFIPDVPVFLKPADSDALVAAVRSALARP